jgi:hypothetical protein
MTMDLSSLFQAEARLLAGGGLPVVLHVTPSSSTLSDHATTVTICGKYFTLDHTATVGTLVKRTFCSLLTSQQPQSTFKSNE